MIGKVPRRSGEGRVLGIELLAIVLIESFGGRQRVRKVWSQEFSCCWTAVSDRACGMIADNGRLIIVATAAC